MKLHYKSLIGLFAFLLLFSCSQMGGGNDTGAQDKVSTDGTTEYMESLVAKSGKNTITLDMADDKQYSYMKNAYLEAGKTPESDPELFANLEKAREAALNGVELDDSAINKGTTTSTIAGLSERDFMVSSVLAMGGKVYVTLTSTVRSGSIASSIMFRVTDIYGNPLSTGPGGWVMGQDFTTGGRCFTITTDFPITHNSAMFINITGYEMVNVNNIVTQKMTNVKTFVGNNDPGLMARIHIEHPRDLNGDGVVKVGVTRGWIHQDDYWPMPQYYGKIKIPLKGAFRVPFKVTPAQINKNQTYMKLIGPTKGGTVAMKYLGSSGQSLSDAFTFSEGPNNSTLIEWDISAAQSWFDENYFNDVRYLGMKRVNWYLNISFTQAEIMPGVIFPITFCASNDFTAPNYLPTAYPYPPHIEFWDTCIAAGSMVKMANGSLVPVEKVKMGDVVKGNGADLTVVDISVGKELQPMFRIVDEAAHNLLLTEHHPVITKSKGIIWPSELAVGDMIITEEGTKEIVYIGKEMYDGIVYNLMLGTEEELAAAGNNSNMFYANGILIADGAMQMKYETKNEK